jgi:hypothetical protein
MEPSRREADSRPIGHTMNFLFYGIGKVTTMMQRVWTHAEPLESSSLSAILFNIHFNIVPPCTQLLDTLP